MATHAAERAAGAADARWRGVLSVSSRVGYLWSAGGVAAATGCFYLVHAYVDKGQASLLYLPVVIACAIRFGFGPAVLGALLSFLCWDFFFLPPAYTFTVSDPQDWLSLVVFLVAAVTTAQLAARARLQTEEARAREAEVATLFEASEAITREISAAQLLDALAQQLRALCHATRCIVFRRSPSDGALRPIAGGDNGPDMPTLHRMAQIACEHDQVIGLGTDRRLWDKALAEAGIPSGFSGVTVPLHAADALVGVLHVGPGEDGQPFAPVEERLILTLANHAATVIAREELAAQAAQAAALREADALKDALLSLVSHELRTPLAAIKASASGLLQPGVHWGEREHAEALTAIDREADRLTGLVNNLLDLSRLEAGVWRPAKDWCDLAEVISTVLDRLPAATTDRVVVDTTPDLPLIRADYTQIALVLENLIENAAKYAPGADPITVQASAAHDGQSESPVGITVQVRDRGPGLTPGEEAQIFTRFFRGSLHQGGPIHGTGLGLALCAAIVRAHGGEIHAANVPADAGSGAAFTFFLPVQ